MFLWDSGLVTGERFCGECGKTKLAQIKIFLGKDRTCRCLDDNARSNDADMTSLLARLINLHTSTNIVSFQQYGCRVITFAVILNALFDVCKKSRLT